MNIATIRKMNYDVFKMNMLQDIKFNEMIHGNL